MDGGGGAHAVRIAAMAAHHAVAVATRAALATVARRVGANAEAAGERVVVPSEIAAAAEALAGRTHLRALANGDFALRARQPHRPRNERGVRADGDALVKREAELAGPNLAVRLVAVARGAVGAADAHAVRDEQRAGRDPLTVEPIVRQLHGFGDAADAAAWSLAGRAELRENVGRGAAAFFLGGDG